jgi:hypothetical protein
MGKMNCCKSVADEKRRCDCVKGSTKFWNYWISLVDLRVLSVLEQTNNFLVVLVYISHCSQYFVDIVEKYLLEVTLYFFM